MALVDIPRVSLGFVEVAIQRKLNSSPSGPVRLKLVRLVALPLYVLAH